MLPETAWWRGNPHYDSLWRGSSPRERLQRQVLDALLSQLPEPAALALLECLMAAEHIGEVQALRTAELTQPLIDAVLAAAAEQAITYRLHGEEVAMIPVDRLRALQTDWFMSAAFFHGTPQEDQTD